MSTRRSLTLPFVGICLAVALAVGVGFEPPLGLQIVGLAAVVALVGLPHGALDPVIARDAGIAAGSSSMGFYLVGYVILAAVTAAAWWAAPAVALPVFFLVSALHFGGDWPDFGPAGRLAAGGAVVLAPLAFQPEGATSLLEPLADTTTADRLVDAATILGPAAAAAALLLAAGRHRNPRAVAEIGAVVSLAAIAPPLIAFGTYFCALHSPRHIAAVLRRSHIDTTVAVRTAGIFTVATIVLAALAWPALESMGSTNDAAVRLGVVGLAALTVPHMTTIERARRDRHDVPATAPSLDPPADALIRRSFEPDRKDLR